MPFSVNRASRLESAAENGTIYISEDTYSLVEEYIEATALPSLNLKGIGDFNARKVVGEVNSDAITVSVGKRNFSLKPEQMSAEELHKMQSCLESALKQLNKYSEKQRS